MTSVLAPSLILVPALLLAVVLASCGSDDSAANGAPGDAGAADVSTPRLDGTSSETDSALAESLSEVSLDAAAPEAVDAGPDAPATDASGDGAPPSFTTVFTIVLHTGSYDTVVGSSSAPYINSLIGQYGLATNYSNSGSYPSVPNLLYLVSGETQYPGFVDVAPTMAPSFPIDHDNLGAQLTRASIAWRAYQEASGTPCNLGASGPYASKCDPFLYFDDIQNGANGLCAETNVDYSAFAGDLAAGTYRYMWLTPELDHNGSSGLASADTWCSQQVPAILNSTVFKAGGVLFLTWDEGDGNALGYETHVPMIVISPRIKSAGYQSSVAYTHASYLATVETIFGLPLLGAAANATNMMEFFR